MTQEILKLALEYIEAVPDDRYNAEHIDRAALITAIEEALAQPEQDYERGFIGGMQKQMQSSVDKAVNRMAQPEQEPWCMKMNGCKTKCEDCPDEPPDICCQQYDTCLKPCTPRGVHLAQRTEQEPVAWMTQARNFIHLSESTEAEAKLYDWKAVYTHSQRTWVGLTDEERSELVTLHHGWNEYGQAIEAKLKEKNT